nr:MAG TPA: hypothetical protein [Caudoviricetes sp.]
MCNCNIRLIFYLEGQPYRFIDSSRVRLRQGFEKYLASGAEYLSWLLIPPHSLCDK